MKLRQSCKWLATILVLSIALASPAAAFYVGYNYYAYATESDGIPLMDDGIMSDEWYVAGDYIKTGAAGNYGIARFCADVSTATVSVYASTHGLQTGPYTFPSGKGRVERADFEDRLNFAVPAGAYPDGVQVRLHGRAVGSIWSEVGASVQFRCYVLLGAARFEIGLQEIGTAEVGTISFDETFSIVAEIVAPGVTLNETQVYSKTVHAAIRRAWASSTSFNPGGGNVIGDAEIDFVDGLRIVALEVPPGVSWTSDSGMFPFLPSPVPDASLAVPEPQLLGNTPNPFNPVTVIAYELPAPAPVTLGVYDIAGRLVRTLRHEQWTGAGRHEVIWSGRDMSDQPVAAGVYSCQLDVRGFRATKRMTLLK